MKILYRAVILSAFSLSLPLPGFYVPVFADSGFPVAEEDEKQAEEDEIQRVNLFHSLKIEEESLTGRYRIISQSGNPAERVDAAVIHLSEGNKTEVFPGLRTPHMSAGSLSPEGLLAVARTGRFAGYSVSSDYTTPGITVDFGLGPVQRRGMAFFFPDNGACYWVRDTESSESGLFYNWSSAEEREVSLLFSRSLFHKTLEPELAAERPHRGRGEEMLRGSAAFWSSVKGGGNISLLASITALATLQRGVFLGASVFGDRERFSWSLAGDYKGDYYIYYNGKAAGGETAVSAACTLLPGGPVGTHIEFKLRDRGGEFTPDLYKKSDHEFSAGLFFLADPGRAEIEHFRKWSWETDGEGNFETGTEVSMKFAGRYLSGNVEWNLRKEGETDVGTDFSGEFGGSLKFRRGPVSLDIEGKTGMDYWEYSSQVSLEPGDSAEIYARGMCEDGQYEWTIGWNLERRFEFTD
ncbi:MAG: hypothetical protein ACLFNZ_00835 [Spirochaetaceae bacterium]